MSHSKSIDRLDCAIADARDWGSMAGYRGLFTAWASFIRSLSSTLRRGGMELGRLSSLGSRSPCYQNYRRTSLCAHGTSPLSAPSTDKIMAKNNPLACFRDLRPDIDPRPLPLNSVLEEALSKLVG